MLIRKSQADRRADTQLALVTAARGLFAQKGYAGTSTPEIATLAGVTRGALYHHFADKLALFEAVATQEQMLVTMAVNAATAGDDEPGPVKALVAGGDAFLDAMQDPGRRQILLVDAPAVLGRARLDALVASHGIGPLIARVRTAMDAEAIRTLPAEPLAHLLHALFDRAAEAGPDQLNDYRKAIKALIRGLKV